MSTRELTSAELKQLYANIKAAKETIRKTAEALQEQIDFASKADPDLSLAGITPGKPSVDVNRVYSLAEILLPKIALDFIETNIDEEGTGEAVAIRILPGEPSAPAF